MLTVEVFHLPFHVAAAGLLDGFDVKQIGRGQQSLHVSVRYAQLSCVGVVDDQLHYGGIEAVYGHMRLLALRQLRVEHGVEIVPQRGQHTLVAVELLAVNPQYYVKHCFGQSEIVESFQDLIRAFAIFEHELIRCC